MTEQAKSAVERPTPRGIVVGVDGSPWANNAVRWAAREAVVRHVPLTLVHVLTKPVASRLGWTFSTAPVPADFGEWEQDEQARRLLDEAMKLVEDDTADSGPPEVEGQVSTTGPVFSSAVSALVDLTEEAEMIVVGSRAQGGGLRSFLGSVGTGLVHHAHCPVAVIPDHDPDELAASQAPVLVGVDGSRASDAATAIAFDEAAWRGVELVALHAWSDVDVADSPTEDWSVTESNAQENLAKWLAAGRERHPEVTVHPVVVPDQPARHLLAQSEDAQLVVVGSRGRGGFAGALLGSVSTALVLGTHAPVIVARDT